MTSWLQLDDNVRTVDIVGSPNCLLQRHGSGEIWLYTGPPMTGWRLLDDNPATVQVVAMDAGPVGASGDVTVVQRHRHGALFATTVHAVGTGLVPHPVWTRLDDNRATVDVVAAGGHLLQRHADGSVWIYTGVPMTGSDRIDDGPGTLQVVANDPGVYKLADDGSVSTYSGTPTFWIRHGPADPATTRIAAAGTRLYKMHADGTVLLASRPFSAPGHFDEWWVGLDDNRATVDIVAAGDKLFQRHADGSIWVHTGPPMTGWKELDHDPAAVQVAATLDVLYKRHERGGVYQLVE